MSTFKFKGVIRKGKDTGEIIEYSAEEKVPLALQSAVTSYEAFKSKYLASVTDVKINSLNVVPKGEPLKKKWSHNLYTAEGTVVLLKRDVKKDMMVKPATQSFALKFEDCLSHNGLPEFNILSFRLD